MKLFLKVLNYNNSLLDPLKNCKRTATFVMNVCLSIRQCGTNRFSMDGFVWHTKFLGFLENMLRNRLISD
jgi:hypothetical protein